MPINTNVDQNLNELFLQISSRINFLYNINQKDENFNLCHSILKTRQFNSLQISENLVLMVWMSIFKNEINLSKYKLINQTTKNKQLSTQFIQEFNKIEEKLQISKQYFYVSQYQKLIKSNLQILF